MLVYIDDQCACHTVDNGMMEAVETTFFDGKCATYIEGYRYIPKGKTWTRSDGMVFSGEMISPIADHRVLEAAQGEVVTLSEAGAAQVKALCIATNSAPDADAGVFVNGVEPWEAGKTYSQYDLVEYKGSIAYVKQLTLTAQETFPPFALGTEALYGARPAPDRDGVYPYVYNMAASVGMKVREDGEVYECIQAISGMLFKPSQLAAHFELID